jgi:hypothetical protein
MNYLKKYGIQTSLVLALVFMSSVSFVKANPSFFIRQQSASATTTVSYMTAGTATTTLVFDTGVNAAGSTDGAVLLTQFTASTTASQVAYTFEYSQDAVDWYSDRLDNGATTTPQINLSTETTYLLTGVGERNGGVAGTSSTTLRAIVAKTPTRYIRAIYTIPVGSGNGAVYGEFIAKRQSN